MMAAYLIALTEALHLHKPILNMNRKYTIHIIYIYIYIFNFLSGVTL